MPHALSSTSEDEKSCTCHSDSKMVQMKSKLRNRFYEPIILLKVLMGSGHSPSPEPVDLDEAGSTPEQDFYIFVNKLGQICDSKRGAETVTAFVVLQFPDKVQYQFASNARSESQLEGAKDYLTDVLHAVKQGAPFSDILRRVLKFVRPRITFYLKTISSELSFCIHSCEREGKASDDILAAQLREAQTLVDFCSDRELDDGSFVTQCETFMQFLYRLYKRKSPDLWDLIKEKAKESQMDESYQWSEIRHAAGRLLSYYIAIKVLFLTKKQFPTLFEEFEVSSIPSSRRSGKPLSNKDHSVKAIIGRMTADATRMRITQANAEKLECMELDEKIRTLAGKLKPLVHAEVLLDHWLEGNGLILPSNFFKNWRYIGCSKPTCKLCSYYFTHRGTGMKVRQGHGHLYPDWKLPDVYELGSATAVEAAAKARDLMTNKMVGPIREEAFGVLSAKVTGTRGNDSNSSPTVPPGLNATTTAGSAVHVGDYDDLESRFGQVDITEREDISDSSEGSPWPESPRESSTDDLDGFGSDEENCTGGATL